MVSVELIYLPLGEPVVHCHLALEDGATVADVLMQSEILKRYPEIQDCCPVGIFSKRVSLKTVVKTGDRIEIYRSLTLHPMEKRRKRAQRSSRG